MRVEYLDRQSDKGSKFGNVVLDPFIKVAIFRLCPVTPVPPACPGFPAFPVCSQHYQLLEFGLGVLDVV